MINCHPLIPQDIFDELSPRARVFFCDLIDDYLRQIIDLRTAKPETSSNSEQPHPAISGEQEMSSPPSNANPKLTSSNSSIPPSTEHPHSKKNKKKRKSKTGKKRGGQPGHTRSTRPLIPTEECTHVEPLLPRACRKCGHRLKGKDPEPLRHQVFELPVIQPIVTEYQRHRLTCECCGTQTCAELPPQVPTGQCGPRLAAFTGLLMGHFRQSKRRAASFLTDLLNIPCSASWTVKIQNLVSHSLEKPYAELQTELAKQEQLFVDESPTKEGEKKAWLWVAVAPLFAVFGIFLNRKRESLKALVGNYAGLILNCDRAKMYLDGKVLQWCWAHLKRDFQKLIDNPDQQVKRLGHDLMRQEKRLFELWHKYKHGEIAWSDFRTEVAPIRTEVNALLLRGLYSGNKKLIGFCKELDAHRDWLWTFAENEGIEPTNNTAERALRPAVIYRKLSFGTQSAQGSRFIERILTVSETCKMQKRSPFQFLVAATTAYFAKKKPPSLLPSPKSSSNKKAA